MVTMQDAPLIVMGVIVGVSCGCANPKKVGAYDYIVI